MKNIRYNDSIPFPWVYWLAPRERLVLAICMLIPPILIVAFFLFILLLVTFFTSWG